MTDVSALVVEMRDLLAKIQNTLASLDPNVHDAKLDELERKRDDAIEGLSAAYLAESELLNTKRKAEREALAEQRRKEDEERERRRHEEDERLAARDLDEDHARDGKFKEDTAEVEEEMDDLMNLVEEEARLAAAEGREKIRAMQERRRVGLFVARVERAGADNHLNYRNSTVSSRNSWRRCRRRSLSLPPGREGPREPAL